MIFKRIAVAGATAGLLLTSAAGTFAFGGGHHWVMPSNDVSVKNYGSIRNTSVNVANTGLNKSTGFWSMVGTGNAVALQNTSNGINTVVGCGCAAANGDVSVKNYGGINNLSVNVANTGLNWGGSVHTGDALAGQDVINVVSTGVASD